MSEKVILSVNICLFIVFIKYRIFFGKILILKSHLLLNSYLTVKYSGISDLIICFGYWKHAISIHADRNMWVSYF